MTDYAMSLACPAIYITGYTHPLTYMLATKSRLQTHLLAHLDELLCLSAQALLSPASTPTLQLAFILPIYYPDRYRSCLANIHLTAGHVSS